MIIHTIVPVDCVLEQAAHEYEYQVAPHGFAQVEKGQNGHTLSRLISTNPADYLKSEYIPGSPWQQTNKEPSFEEQTSFRI